MPVLDPNGLLAEIESARHTEKYLEMFVGAATLTVDLIPYESRKAYALRSRVYYEMHMAFYQIAMKSEGRARIDHFQTSRGLAEKSAEKADVAEDPLGRLFAEMNISGLIMPALGKWKTGIEMSNKVSETAYNFATSGHTTAENKRRALQICMNSSFHRIKMYMEYGQDNNGSRVSVAYLVRVIKTDPLFTKQRDETWVKEAMAEAEKFIQG